MAKKLLIAVVGVSLLIGCMIGCTQMLGKRASIIKTPEVAPGAEYRGTETCLECHENHADDKYNVHMRVASFEVSGYRIGCEGCHGPGSVHVDEDGNVEKILRFGQGGLKSEEVAGVCTTCHQDGALMNWAGSAHQEDDVSCLECHSVHFNKEKTLLKNTNEFELCGQCHQDIKAKGYLMSRHPVREGKMGCTDCHSPHGTDNLVSGMLKTDERLNDLCLKCHTRYQGPFVFEHEPVVEDCTFCHDAHGTVANNLLLQNEPFLCL
ncbi:MAG: DmsE family decaheme c-type cytochrome, partial [Deltaproteobacteria bacterium]